MSAWEIEKRCVSSDHLSSKLFGRRISQPLDAGQLAHRANRTAENPDVADAGVLPHPTDAGGRDRRRLRARDAGCEQGGDVVLGDDDGTGGEPFHARPVLDDDLNGSRE